MNANLTALLDWAESHGIDLDQATLSPKWHKIYFYHDNETAHNMRTVKRAVGGFRTEGKPPYVTLEATVEYGDHKIKVVYEGGLKCEITHHCKPATFADGTSLAFEASDRTKAA